MIRPSMYIAVDFDGTLVEDSFPEIGKEIPYAVETVKFIIDCGHKVILHTSRTHYIYDGHDTLAEAESKYYSILAAAAISKVPVHSAIIVSEEGFPVKHQCYKHN